MTTASTPSSARRIALRSAAACAPAVIAVLAAPAALAIPVDVQPSGDAPGTQAFSNFISGFIAYGSLAALVALMLGGIAWALGERLGMDRASQGGRMGVLAGLGLGFLMGGVVSLINKMITAGGGQGNLAITGNTANAPGYAIIAPVAGWFLTYGALAAVAAAVLGGIGWALGERLGFDRMSLVGKGGVFAGMGLGLLTGCAVALVNFVDAAGSNF